MQFEIPDLSEYGIPADAKVWTPQPKQAEFLAIPFEVKEALYGGAAFGGKSEVLLAAPVYYKFHLDPEFVGIIFRRNYPEMFKSLLPRSERFYRPFGGEWNGEKKCWEFRSGARLFLGYLDSMKAARAHDTNQFNYVAFEEATHFPYEEYSFLAHSRVRSTTSRLPAIVRLASNPGNIGHKWVKDRFVKPNKDGGVLLKSTLENGESVYRMFIKALVQDNPIGLANDPSYINMLLQLPEAEKRAKLYGDWDAYVGDVFPDWREKCYSDEPENALHVVEPFDIPYWWPKVAAIDWGYSAMCWMGWMAISPDRRLYMYRELAVKKSKISSWASEFAALTAGDGNFKGIWLDPSAWQMRGEESSIADQFQRWSGYVPNRADNSRVSGKQLLLDVMRWKQKPPRVVPRGGYSGEVYQRILRSRGDIAAASYAALFLPEVPEMNLPVLQVFNTCEKFIEVIPQCVADESNPEDVAEFSGDDPYDGGRYLVKAAVNYMDDSVSELEGNRKLSEVVGKLATSGDMTEFHRRMYKLEASSRPQAVHHSRFRSA